MVLLLTESQERTVHMRFGVITAVNVKTEVFWLMTACSLVVGYEVF